MEHKHAEKSNSESFPEKYPFSLAKEITSGEYKQFSESFKWKSCYA